MSSVIRQLRTEPLSPSPLPPPPQLLSSHRPVADTRGNGSTRRAVLILCFRPAREDNFDTTRYVHGHSPLAPDRAFCMAGLGQEGTGD